MGAAQPKYSPAGRAACLAWSGLQWWRHNIAYESAPAGFCKENCPIPRGSFRSSAGLAGGWRWLITIALTRDVEAFLQEQVRACPLALWPEPMQTIPKHHTSRLAYALLLTGGG